MFGETFGVTNGAITILALVVGMKAAGASQRAMVSAMIALLISDPISDAYALYNAHSSAPYADEVKARWVAFKAFGAQAVLQTALLISVATAPNVRVAVRRCALAGVFLVVGFERFAARPVSDTARNLLAMCVLVMVTHVIERQMSQMEARVHSETVCMSPAVD